ncbi:MAG: energy transducer TonB [Proteobacteria bacterium]|nr:energy transducer TonB [Pseudomonadota bacterium]
MASRNQARAGIHLAFSLSLAFHGLLVAVLLYLAPRNIRLPQPVEFEIHRTSPPKVEEKKQEIKKKIVDLTKARDLKKIEDLKMHRSSKVIQVEEIKPVVGVTEDSLAREGDFSVPVGNTLMGTPENKVQEVHYAPLFRVTELPRFRENIKPVYPDLARRMGIAGTVVLEVSIDEEGKVIDAVVKQGLGYGCDESALESVRKARFYPARADDGQPVAVKVQIPFHFRLVD